MLCYTTSRYNILGTGQSDAAAGAFEARPGKPLDASLAGAGDLPKARYTAPVGVLLLSVGSPETVDDVEEYLYNVFRDPELLTLPQPLSWAWGWWIRP